MELAEPPQRRYSGICHASMTVIPLHFRSNSTTIIKTGEFMRKKIFIIAILCLMFCLTGCDGKTKISGTVKFSDGTPITKGNVVFDNGNESYFGTIKSDGTYVTGGNKQIEGIPNGNYKVWLAQTEIIENVLGADGRIKSYSVTPTVAKKFTSPNTTELTFELKPDSPKTFDVVVEKP
jgi:hypothetical protein